MDFQRAAQAYIWSTPLVSLATWRIEEDRNYHGGELGTFVVLETLKEKRGIVTGNLTTPYIFQFGDLSDGPIVIEYPAGPSAGGFLDAWQRPVTDVGQTGPDKGQGGTYILVGPDDDPAQYETEIVFVRQSPTNSFFIGLRILDPDPKFAAAYKAGLKMARLGDELEPGTFVEGLDKEWSATAFRGMKYWETLHKMINVEPVREQDKIMMAMLEPLGIVRGEPFAPTERQTRILLDGAAFGEMMTRNLQVNPRFAEPWWPTTSWYKSFDFTIPQITETKVELDERAT